MASLRIGLAVVHGRSMWPTLTEGDVVLVRYDVQPRPGQLVVVRLPNRPVSVKRAGHRGDGGWWVERDNPLEGVDSRLVGEIPDCDVLACVWTRVWPPRRRLGSRPDAVR